MASRLLVPCLAALDAEIDRHAPGRDHTSDGDIGDTAHQSSVSDHNPDETGRVPIHDADHVDEVHALDVDESGPWPWAGGMRTLVQHIVRRCQSGAERRLRYVIFDGTIWTAANLWRPSAYTGQNRHTQHAHFSASYDTHHEQATYSWNLEGIPIMLTDADLAKIRVIVQDLVDLRVGDRIRYFDDDGELVPVDDRNPTIAADTALHHLLRNTVKLQEQVDALAALLADRPPTG